MDLGRVGIWTFALDQQPAAAAREAAAELEALGYGTLWLPEAVGREPFVHAALLLSATSSLQVATGVASIHARTAMTAAAAQRTLAEAFPGRFLLGLGVSHQPMVEGILGGSYGKPVAAMRAYLDGIDHALYFAAAPPEPPRRVLAALGPRMLELARERADGAHTYNVTVEHTIVAREALGPGKLLVPELAAVLSTDAEAARAVARQHLAVYLNLPNYANNWFRHGFGPDDVAGGGSDRLVDALVPWGDVERIATAVRNHLDAGADQVCVQLLAPDTAVLPMDGWRELAPALTAL